jgi:hypothetical protein
MQKAFDFSYVRILLRRMIASGYVTLEQLDRPSLSWQNNAKTFRLHYPNYQQPTFRNLLSDQDPAEAVTISDPRDFTPTAEPFGTPADSFRSGSASVLLDAHRPLDETQHYQGGQQQNAKGTGEDQRNERRPAGMGATGDDHSSFHGTIPDDW